jgi:hypothetical protein
VPISIANSGDLDEVVIRIADDPSPLAGSAGQFVFEHSAQRSLIKIHGVADFEIREGRQILVWPASGATQKDIEIFLLGQAWATLCHQRGTLPLHASAIVTKRGIAAFAGRSGAGKSTTAALLNGLGYELIADDIISINFDHNLSPGAWPYLRRFKLHLDSIAQLGLTPSEIVSDKLDNKKFFVPPKYEAGQKWRRLDRLYLLENGAGEPGICIEQITGADAVRALVDHTYQFRFIHETGMLGEHLLFCTKLAAKILIYRLRYSPRAALLNSFICAHLENASTKQCSAPDRTTSTG